jgi:hypothetical protein
MRALSEWLIINDTGPVSDWLMVLCQVGKQKIFNPGGADEIRSFVFWIPMFSPKPEEPFPVVPMLVASGIY